MNYRSIDIGTRETRRANLGAPPEQGWLPLPALVIDDDFQRPLGRGNWSAIEKIAAAFKWEHFTPVVVAPVGDGKYSIIDGQHRCHAAALLGITDVPVMITYLTEAQQAAAFGAINGQVTAVTPVNIYRAAFVAREAWAIACDQVVKDAGCRLMQSHQSAAEKMPGQISSIALIRKHVAADRGAMVTAGLTALWASPSAAEKRTWSNSILSPWLYVLQENPRALRRDLPAFIAAHDPLRTAGLVNEMRSKPEYAAKSTVFLMQGVLKAQLNRWMGG